ncbi:MAG TPA: YdcF family protein [Bryobacteraceae bacterium]|nr:YdcF family protein [Bryobacteraceae bacterium]
MVRRSSFFVKSLVCIVIVLALAAATHWWWLAALGRLLVRDEGPAHADMAVVLAGDYYGNRVVRAAELVKQGYVPKVLVSGPNMLYGFYECDLEIAFAVKRGYPESWFIRAPNEAHSTREEAATIVTDLRRRGVHRFLLVTSDFHTARAGRIYRAAAPDLNVRVVAAPDRYFRADGWWRNREARKLFLMEWMKTVANAVGI